MKNPFKKKKFSVILFISFSIIIIWCLFINELLINNKNNNINSDKISTKLETINIDQTLLRNFNIYIKRSEYRWNDRRNHFSINASNMIGGYRQLPDTRLNGCKEKLYDIQDDITVSVIITYFNEERSTLLRSIVSVLQRTPKKYLKEIIIIDDFNKDATQGVDLQFLPLIKLIRNNKRIGVIESRNIAANIAIGEYIFFMDSNCEVNTGWLEPLLSRLILYPGTAVSPILDIIDSKTFQYQTTKSFLKGGFDWKLNFNWIPMNEEEREQRLQSGNEISPFASPVFSGGIFMISKDWFTKLRGFNPQLKLWGGESIEMAIKLWLCGGQIELVPCSRVGHVFTQKHSFELPSGENTASYLSNAKVIAESWLDEYKQFFYSFKPKAMNITMPELNEIKRLKTDLKCRPFSWYFDIVFPELKLPNEEYVAFGKLSSGNKCLTIRTVNVENENIKKQTKYQIVMKDCQDTDVLNWYLHSETGKLSTESGTICINVNKKTEIVVIEKCIETKCNGSKLTSLFSSSTLLSSTLKMDNQRWVRSGGNLIHKESQLCLDNFYKDMINVTLCRRGNPSQLFSFSVELTKL